MPMTTKNRQRRELTLKDRLSRLTYLQACKLLGPEGRQLLRQGGRYDTIDLDEQVYLDGEVFRLRLHDAVVNIVSMAEAYQNLQLNCSQCRTACVHMGAALSLILEEKTALGLAAPPPERIPVESLSEDDLVHLAVAERQERARKERMRVQSSNRRVLWTDYLVTNAESGKTYRVALRGWEPGQSYCSCPDFRKNTLGLCKHVLRVQQTMRRKFSKAAGRQPYRQKEIAIYLRYGKELELRILLPDRLDDACGKIARPLADQPIQDVHDLMKRINKLTALGHEVTVYPDAEEYINRWLFQDRMETMVAAIRKDPKKHPLRKQLLKTELLPYQLDGIAFAVGAGRAILADDMGLGKTIQGVGVAEMLAREAGIRKVLVVCPASVKSQWRGEIERFSDRPCQLVIGGAAARARQYENDCFFTICNYEQVLRDLLAIERNRWDLIILDEGQRIKNWEAQTSRVIKALRSPFALVLSGTPLENRLEELFSVVEFIDDRRLGPAFRFFNRHRMVDERGKVLGYKNLSELRRRLQPVLLRRTRSSVMQELPPRSTEIVRIPPTEEQLDLHGAHMRVVSSIVRKPYITEMDMLRLKKALLMCRMSANSTFLVDKNPPGYSSKLQSLQDLLANLADERDRKILLFSEWTTMLDLIEPLTREHKLDYVRLDGSVPQKKRQQLVQTFQRQPKCRMFLTTNAGSTGLNLQAANTVINVDLPWNPAVLEQRVGRAHRMGQRNPVQVFVLVTEQTIEENLLQTLSAKRELALAALDVESEVDAVDMVTGMDELKNRLEILLGSKPEAPVDESEKARQAAEVERLARRQQLSSAGSALLNAALTFLDELLPAPKETEALQNMTRQIGQRLSESLDKDAQGRPSLTLTLPETVSLDRLAGSLARILSAAG